ncbi:ATP-binding protein [Desulfurobacterium sp.]
MGNLIDIAKRLTVLKLSQKTPDYKRFLYNQIKENPSKLIGIYGGRGVGKTTLMVQLLKELNLPPSKALFVSCDHPAFSGFSLFDFLEEYASLGGKYVFIDEIHKVRDFESHLKSAYDFLDLKIFFSGSSAIYLNNADFIRRFSMFRLPILSFREFIELSTGVILPDFSLEEIINKHEEISFEVAKTLSISNKKILELFEEYKIHGAYPFFFEDPDKFLDRLSASIDMTISSDIAFLYSINPEKVQLIKKLLITICVSEPLELSIEKLASLVGVSKTTLYKYIEYLSRADLVIHIQHEAKRFRAVRKPDKLYLANTNLLSALCLEKKKGTERETFFASMLNYQYKLNYVDRGDFLVDEKFIFEVGGKRKTFNQIKDIENSYLATDEIEIGSGNRIPLWLFGFVY